MTHTVNGKLIGPGEILFRCEHCHYDIILKDQGNGTSTIWTAHPGKLDCQHTGEFNGIIFPLPVIEAPAGELAWLKDEDAKDISDILDRLNLPKRLDLNPADLAWLEETLRRLE